MNLRIILSSFYCYLFIYYFQKKKNRAPQLNLKSQNHARYNSTIKAFLSKSPLPMPFYSWVEALSLSLSSHTIFWVSLNFIELFHLGISLGSIFFPANCSLCFASHRQLELPRWLMNWVSKKVSSVFFFPLYFCPHFESENDIWLISLSCLLHIGRGWVGSAWVWHLILISRCSAFLRQRFACSRECKCLP